MVFALDDALKVTVELPAPLIELGLKLAVKRLGRPLADKFTSELNLLTATVENVTVPVLPLSPCFTESIDGETDTVKKGVTTTLTVIEKA